MVTAVNAGDPGAYTAFQNDEREYSDHKYSPLEKRLAREVIATGRMLEGDARLEDVVRALAESGADMIPMEGPRLGLWVERQLDEIIPKTGNAMADAALIAAGREMAGTAGGITRQTTGRFISSARGRVLSGSDTDLAGATRGLDNALTEGLIRSLVEGGRAAAGASGVHALTTLELDYTLAEGGLDEVSVLAVQPFYESVSKRHNIFGQASYSNREVEDLGASTSGKRDTLNAGLGYRYITPDEQHMFGVNAFVDHEFDYNHNRMSVGLDYKNALIGAHLNRYIGLSDWRGRGDGFEEKALSGTDLELSGRLPQLPELELFARGFNWEQERTPIFEPDGDDIWGYELSAEYTPVNIFTLRGAAIKDNTMDDVSAEVTVRLNYTFGDDIKRLGQAPNFNLDSVLDRRFEKVRRQNDIRAQVRQDPNVTARVTFAQGANVTLGQVLPFGTTIITGTASGDGATVEFGSGAILDIGQNTEVLIEEDVITLITGTIGFTSASGASSPSITTPGTTIELIGTDVDVRVAGSITTLRVRDGAADFTDEQGATSLTAGQLAEAVDGDGMAPQVITTGPNFDTHVRTALNQLTLTGPSITTANAAPAAAGDVTVTGTFEVGETLTFTVPLTKAVNVDISGGTPELEFDLGVNSGDAIFTGGSGTKTLTFDYLIQPGDAGESTITINRIDLNGGEITDTADARPLVPEMRGQVIDTVAVTNPVFVGFTNNTGNAPGNRYAVGDTIEITLDANQDLDTHAGSASLEITIGSSTETANFATFDSGDAVFTFGPLEHDSPGGAVEVTAINNAGDLQNAAGDSLDASGFSGPFTGAPNVGEVLGKIECPTGDLTPATHVGCGHGFGDPTNVNVAAIYAGDVPDDPFTGTDFFVARCDESTDGSTDFNTGTQACDGTGDDSGGPNSFRWKDSNTESDTVNLGFGSDPSDTAAVNGTNTAGSPDGNTKILFDDPSGDHPAAEQCADRPGDWYLPAISELDIIYVNLVVGEATTGDDDTNNPVSSLGGGGGGEPSPLAGPLVDSFSTVGFSPTLYWSSSERLDNSAWFQLFSDGNQNASLKNFSRPVRCARR